ncbi:MAG: hypothetical protein IT442_12530, partial [Phycisphaeraceae bacterium]|nr:hypothetical protein [Phycisphaeraceae bacterium]
MDLEVLIEYVSRRLKINILYDAQVSGKKVTLRAPAQIPESSLLGVLESALRMKGLALVDAEQAGWKKVVVTTSLTDITSGVREGSITSAAAGQGGEHPESLPGGAPPGAGETITQVFRLQYAMPEKVSAVLKPFLTPTGANTVELPELRMLIITDFATNFRRLTDLIKLADQPGPPIVIELVAVKNLQADQLAQQVARMLLSKQRVLGTRSAGGIMTEVSADLRTNQLILVGTQVQVDEARGMAATLDVPLGLETKIYQFSAVSPERMNKLIKELIDPTDAARLYRSAIDNEAGLLVVTTTPAIHEQLIMLKKDLDAIPDEGQNPIRLYKLENTTAVDVLATIRSLEGGEDLATLSVGEEAADQKDAVGAADAASPVVSTSSNAAAASTSAESPDDAAESQAPSPALGGLLAEDGNGRRYSRVMDRSLTKGPGKGRDAAVQGIRTKNATLTADVNTNSIIVIAQPAVQKVYEQLIKMLDKRRPQVLIEATVATLDTSGGFSLGVEISGRTDQTASTR